MLVANGAFDMLTAQEALKARKNKKSEWLKDNLEFLEKKIKSVMEDETFVAISLTDLNKGVLPETLEALDKAGYVVQVLPDNNWLVKWGMPGFTKKKTLADFETELSRDKEESEDEYSDDDALHRDEDDD